MNKNSLKLAMATGTLLAGGDAMAHADIIYTDLSSAPPSASGNTLYLSLTNQAAYFSSNAGTQFKVYGGKGANNVSFAVDPTISTTSSSSYQILSDGGSGAALLSAGDSIGAAGTFATSLYLNAFSGTTGYAGVTLTDPSNPLQTDYGWVLLGVTPTSIPGNYFDYNSATVYGFAYDNTGASILAGAVPEPANDALAAVLLTGSLALAAARRMRRESVLS